MFALFRLFFEICLFRAGPEDTPKSRTLPWLVGIAAVITSIRPVEDFWIPVAVSTVQLALLAWLVRMLLGLRNLAERAGQVLSAVFGTHVVLNLVALPVISWVYPVADQPRPLPVLLLFGLVLWSFAVMTHIYRRAFNTTIGGGAVLTLLMLMILYPVTVSMSDWLS